MSISTLAKIQEIKSYILKRNPVSLPMYQNEQEYLLPELLYKNKVSRVQIDKVTDADLLLYAYSNIEVYFHLIKKLPKHSLEQFLKLHEEFD